MSKFNSLAQLREFVKFEDNPYERYLKEEEDRLSAKDADKKRFNKLIETVAGKLRYYGISYKFQKSRRSNSVYFIVGDNQIRVSDHQTTRFNPDSAVNFLNNELLTKRSLKLNKLKHLIQ